MGATFRCDTFCIPAIPSAFPFPSPPPVPYRRLDRERSRPGIFALECLVEVENVRELFARVRRLAHEQAKIHEREDDVTDIGAAPHAPVLEDEARHDSEPLQREIATGQRKLFAGDVATL